MSGHGYPACIKLAATQLACTLYRGKGHPSFLAQPPLRSIPGWGTCPCRVFVQACACTAPRTPSARYCHAGVVACARSNVPHVAMCLDRQGCDCDSYFHGHPTLRQGHPRSIPQRRVSMMQTIHPTTPTTASIICIGATHNPLPEM